MKTIKISSGEFDLLESGKGLCFTSGIVSVGKEYLLKDPSERQMKVRCTQNCPHHVIKVK